MIIYVKKDDFFLLITKDEKSQPFSVNDTDENITKYHDALHVKYMQNCTDEDITLDWKNGICNDKV